MARAFASSLLHPCTQLKQASEEGNAADAAAPVTATGEGAPSEGVGGSGSKRTALAGRGGRRGAKRARRGQKGGAAVARGVQDRMDEEDTGDENRAGLGHAGDGSGHICVEMVNAWANALARKLVELYDAAQVHHGFPARVSWHPDSWKYATRAQLLCGHLDSWAHACTCIALGRWA